MKNIARLLERNMKQLRELSFRRKGTKEKKVIARLGCKNENRQNRLLLKDKQKKM